MLTLVLYFLLGYCALFSVVWLHEIGHSLWNFWFGCRADWIHVQVKPYIFFSTPGPVDLDKYQALAPWQHVLSAYGGVIANLFWGSAGGAALFFIMPDNLYVRFFLWMFITLHFAETVSYLVIGSIYLVSDMAIVVGECPHLRIPSIAVGLVLTVIYILALISVPQEFRLFILVWNLIAIFSMCGGRIVFSLLHSKNG